MLAAIALLLAAAFFRSGSSPSSAAATSPAQRILDAVAQVDPEHAPDLQRGAPPAPSAEDTWCNKFIVRVCRVLGLELPWGEYGTPANHLIEWMRDGNDGWYSVNAFDARLLALAGHVVVAAFFNPFGHGHMALVLPLDGPMQTAQAGAVNFNRGLIEDGFGILTPEFFANDRGLS